MLRIRLNGLLLRRNLSKLEGKKEQLNLSRSLRSDAVKDSMTDRPKQTDCCNEPPYPGLDTVVFCIRDPDWACHGILPYCSIEYPHLISECGEFEDNNALQTRS